MYIVIFSYQRPTITSLIKHTNVMILYRNIMFEINCSIKHCIACLENYVILVKMQTIIYHIFTFLKGWIPISDPKLFICIVVPYNYYFSKLRQAVGRCLGLSPHILLVRGSIKKYEDNRHIFFIWRHSITKPLQEE